MQTDAITPTKISGYVVNTSRVWESIFATNSDLAIKEKNPQPFFSEHPPRHYMVRVLMTLVCTENMNWG